MIKNYSSHANSFTYFHASTTLYNHKLSRFPLMVGSAGDFSASWGVQNYISSRGRSLRRRIPQDFVVHSPVNHALSFVVRVRLGLRIFRFVGIFAVQVRRLPSRASKQWNFRGRLCVSRWPSLWDLVRVYEENAKSWEFLRVLPGGCEVAKLTTRRLRSCEANDKKSKRVSA
jgi:hypothetical protein